MLSKIIRNFIAKRVAGRTDDGIMITLTDPKKVDFQAAMLEDLLMRNGIDPKAITSEQQLKNILNQIDAINRQTGSTPLPTSGIRNTESAKVFDLKGRKIENTDNIMGGEELKLDSDLPPPGSRGGKDDIAAPVQSQEETLRNMTEAEIKANLEAQNKSAIEKILKRKNREDVYGLEDYDTTNMSEIKKEIIRTETKLGNLNPDSPDFREKAKVLSDRIIALKNKMREDKAGGGRIGLKGGADAATESFSKSAGSSRPGRTGSVNISSSGGVTFDPGGRDDPVDDRSTFRQTVNQRKAPVKQKSGLEKIFDAGQEFNYLRNLAIGNFPGIAKQLLLNYGKQKLLDDQAMLDTEENKNMMVAELTDMQKKMLEGPQKNLKDIMGISNEEILQNIEKFNNPDAPATIQDIEQFYQQARDGGRIGFFMGSQFPKGLATLREMVKFFSKGKDKERSGSEILKLVNPKQFNRLLEDPNIYRKFDIQKGIGAPELIKNMQADLAKNRTMMVEEILGAAKNIRKSDINTMERKKEIIEEMMKKGIDRETAEEMADTLSTMAEAAAGKKLDTPKLTDEGILELENILKNMETGGKDKRSLNADGGRIGLKDGMNRRTFLKLLGGFASIPIIGKIIKPLKTVKGIKNVPIIKTDNVPGKPEWFDALVNKVIIEGDDVTKRFATKDREIVHMKKIDDDNIVTVTQDLDEGAVRVEYDSPANTFEDTVQLQYKKPKPDEGDPRPTAEFTTAESGPVGRVDGPDDFSLDVDEVGGTSIKDLDSDVSKLKEYATGQKPTMKELVRNIKRKDKAKRITQDPEAQNDAVIRRQGDYDPSYDDYAAGGIARMLGE